MVEFPDSREIQRQAEIIGRQASASLAYAADQIGQLATAKDPILWLAGEEENTVAHEPLERQDEPVPVPLSGLRPWGFGFSLEPAGSSSSSAGAYPTFAGAGEPRSEEDLDPKRRAPFAVDPALNVKVALWHGDVCALDVDAMIAPSASSYTVGSSVVFQRVLSLGGQELRAELDHMEQCKSGEAKISKAYGMPCRWLLHTVGPKYKDKYQTAAENTLHACYRECLKLACESELRTVSSPCLWYNKGYPQREQAHVALRTVRRCLEKLRSQIDTFVFSATSPEEVELYEQLLPLYFPRTQFEVAEGAATLPASCWNEWGEVAVEERQIRIAGDLRAAVGEADEDRGEGLFSLGDDSDRSFLDAKGDADGEALQRLEGTMLTAQTMMEAQHICLRYIRRARELRADVRPNAFVYNAGRDRFDRQIVVLLGARLPPLGVQDERLLPLFVKELEVILARGEKVLLIYVNSGITYPDGTKLEVLREMLAVLGARYSRCVAQVVVLHPGIWFKAAFALGRIASEAAAALWDETVYIEELHELDNFLSVDMLGLPEYVRTFERGG